MKNNAAKAPMGHVVNAICDAGPGDRHVKQERFDRSDPNVLGGRWNNGYLFVGRHRISSFTHFLFVAPKRFKEPPQQIGG
jgi:hypothetical protein